MYGATSQKPPNKASGLQAAMENCAEIDIHCVNQCQFAISWQKHQLCVFSGLSDIIYEHSSLFYA